MTAPGKPSPKKMSGGEAIVDALVRNGVDTAFGIPGLQLDPLFAALHDAQNQIRIVHTRHEQGAGYMALGPGMLNASAAISTGYALSSKMLSVVGQIPSALIGKGTGQLHELPDQLAIAKSLTKFAARMDTPGDAPGTIAEAFRQLNTGRARPVHVEMAMDIMKAEGDVTPVDPPEFYARAEPDPDLIAAAAKLLGEARNPLIFAGGGAVDAGPDLLALAELLQAPVVMSRSAMGVIDSRHPLALTSPHGHALWKDADVVLGVGTRLAPTVPAWGVDDGLKFIRLDLDAAEMSRSLSPAVAIQADAALGLAALCDAVPGHNAMRGRVRCRMHGGAGSGAPVGNRNALRDGFHTASARAERRAMNAFITEMNSAVARLEAKAGSTAPLGAWGCFAGFGFSRRGKEIPACAGMTERTGMTKRMKGNCHPRAGGDLPDLGRPIRAYRTGHPPSAASRLQPLTAAG